MDVGRNYLISALRVIAALGGITVSGRDAAFIASLSPMGAYLEAMELAFAPDLTVAVTGVVPWFSIAVLVAWAIGMSTIGYWRFRTAELA